MVSTRCTVVPRKAKNAIASGPSGVSMATTSTPTRSYDRPRQRSSSWSRWRVSPWRLPKAWSSSWTPPTTPGNLTAIDVQHDHVTLGWDVSTDDVGVVGYDVYRDGSLIAALGTVTSYQNTTVVAETGYQYYNPSL